jgi:hypothetical protein
MKKIIPLLFFFLLAGCATPGQGGRSASGEENVLTSYSNALKKRINHFVRRDYGVAFCGEGEVPVRLILGSKGGLKDCSIDGQVVGVDPKIKEGILNAIKKASPFPPLPLVLQGRKEWAFTILIRVEGLHMTRDDMVKHLKGEIG